MVNRVRSDRQIYLVDPDPDDYSEVVAHLAGCGIRCQFVSSISEALRIRAVPGALWLVNHQLYRLSGHQLRQHLDTFDERYLLLCVGDHRDPSPAPWGKFQLQVPYVGKRLLPLWLSKLLT